MSWPVVHGFIHRMPVWLSVLLGILLETFLGFINGMIMSRIQVFPLIVTIGTSTVFQGISYMISNGEGCNKFPEEFLLLTRAEVLGIPLDVILALVIVLFAGFVYSETVFGFRLIALDGNEEPARLAGINTRRMKIIMYSMCGFFTAIGTMMMLSKANYHQAAFGPGTDILVMTAAVIGGVSFMGGEGNVVGLVAGVFILAVIGNGMQLAGWGTYAQHLVKGLMFLGAIIFDQYRTNLTT
jgi:ribose transport system permease protein